MFYQFLNMHHATRRTNCRRSDYVELSLENLDKHKEEEGGLSLSSLRLIIIIITIIIFLIIISRSCTMLLPNLNPRGHQPPQWDLMIYNFLKWHSRHVARPQWKPSHRIHASSWYPQSLFGRDFSNKLRGALLHQIRIFIGPRCPWGPIYGSGSL